MELQRFEEIIDYTAPCVMMYTDGVSMEVKTTMGRYEIRMPNGDTRFEKDDVGRPLIKEFLRFADRMQKKYKPMWETPKVKLPPQKKNRRKK